MSADIHIGRFDPYNFRLRHNNRDLIADALTLAARAGWRTEEAVFHAFRIGNSLEDGAGSPPATRTSTLPAIEFARAPVRDALDQSVPQEFTALPGKISAKTAAELVVSWLEQGDYPRAPEHDGSNTQGFEICSSTYGVVVLKRWIEFHK